MNEFVQFQPEATGNLATIDPFQDALTGPLPNMDAFEAQFAPKAPFDAEDFLAKQAAVNMMLLNMYGRAKFGANQNEALASQLEPVILGSLVTTLAVRQQYMPAGAIVEAQSFVRANGGSDESDDDI
ncbi:MAG TPA: hypothetical protein VLH38_02300 [Patescibacteria group bacterium]|nr:hypothetical protein [Patescibacteria group bacterium]